MTLGWFIDARMLHSLSASACSSAETNPMSTCGAAMRVDVMAGMRDVMAGMMTTRLLHLLHNVKLLVAAPAHFEHGPAVAPAQFF
jgi:hypothetical protein